MSYTFELAWRGLRQHPRNSILAAITVAVGLAACMTTLTLLHVLSADPLPGRSQHLYLAFVDTVQARHQHYDSLNDVSMADYHMVKPDAAAALLAPGHASEQTALAGLRESVASDDGRRVLRDQDMLATTSSFAPMFGLALREGRNWSAQEDRDHARVALIDAELARQLFGEGDALDQLIRVKQVSFRVIGVVDRFAPTPHAYDLMSWSFDAQRHESMFLPYTTAMDEGMDIPATGSCDDDGKPMQDLLGKRDLRRCPWLSTWVQLDDARQVADYRQYLQHLSEQWPRSQAFGKPAPPSLLRMDAWLAAQKVVPDNVRLNVWLAGAFLLLCLVNVAGLLTAKFLRRGREIGVRRALGAPRRAVFLQHVLEASLVCVAGGVLALPLTLGGLWILRQQSDSFAELAQLDLPMFVGLFALALLVGMLVGVLPAWRAARVQPGLQVKSA